MKITRTRPKCLCNYALVPVDKHGRHRGPDDLKRMCRLQALWPDGRCDWHTAHLPGEIGKESPERMAIFRDCRTSPRRTVVIRRAAWAKHWAEEGMLNIPSPEAMSAIQDSLSVSPDTGPKQ